MMSSLHTSHEPSEFPKSGLFGLWHTIPSYENMLKKTCFSRSFPTALACYMMEREIPLMYTCCGADLRLRTETIDVQSVFNCWDKKLENLKFCFFRKDPNPINGHEVENECKETIDLVIRDVQTNDVLSCLDVYLTVIPDATTFKRFPEYWGAELGLQRKTVAFLILSLYETMRQLKVPILKYLDPIFKPNKQTDTMTGQREDFSEAVKVLNILERSCVKYQRPILMQCLWRTKGQTPILEPNAFDIVVWSNWALFAPLVYRIQLLNDFGLSDTAIKALRSFWELAKSEKPLKEILEDVVGTRDPGKEISLSGAKWTQWVHAERVIRPVIKLKELRNIIDYSKFFHIIPDRQLQQSLQYMWQEGHLE